MLFPFVRHLFICSVMSFYTIAVDCRLCISPQYARDWTRLYFVCVQGRVHGAAQLAHWPACYTTYNNSICAQIVVSLIEAFGAVYALSMVTNIVVARPECRGSKQLWWWDGQEGTYA